MTRRESTVVAVFNSVSWMLFAAVLVVFAALSPEFLTVENLRNILHQSAATAIVATGMTFVLLTAGVDLSVGAIMFVGAAIAGKLARAGEPMWMAIGAMLLVGLVYGAINSLFVTRFKIIPFVATLGTLYFGRGFGLWLTETRAMNLPEVYLQIGAAKWLGIPVPIWLLAVVTLLAHFVLSKTPFGRHVYAVGHSPENARKAGIRVKWVIASVYVISGFCAALGGVIALGQLGAVSPKFGLEREFTAIAAAVLGGASLFGGRGAVLPGTLMGAVLMQTVENGLVILNVDPYLYPLITSGIIFLAVALDSMRRGALVRLSRRKIRVEDVDLRTGGVASEGG